MRTKEIRYFISLQGIGPLPVWGFAIDSGLPVRICVHEASKNVWACDHYDTGKRFGEFQYTKKDAIRHAVYEMRVQIENGNFARAMIGLSMPNVQAQGRLTAALLPAGVPLERRVGPHSEDEE